MFFDLPTATTCMHREHNMPSHLYIPPGKGYRHVCPGCKEVQIAIPEGHTLAPEDLKQIMEKHK